LKITYSSQFKKDYKKLKKQQKDFKKLKEVLDLLLLKQTLPPNYFDHPLIGGWKGYRDCHIEADWVLIYKSTSDKLHLERMGSHSELFD